MMPITDLQRIEILPVGLLDEQRPTVLALKKLAGSLKLEFGWHYLLDLSWIIANLQAAWPGGLAGKRIMDAGAGTGVMQWYLADQGADVTSADRLSRAPHFALENLNREIIELNDFIGKGPVLLCFWSSCCKSAVMQIEAFSSLYEKYKDEHFVMMAIATDDEKTVAKVKPYVKSRNFKFPVLYDTDGNVARTYYAFDVPFSVLIDKSGKITYTHLGYMKGDEIEVEKMIIGLLKD